MAAETLQDNREAGGEAVLVLSLPTTIPIPMDGTV